MNRLQNRLAKAEEEHKRKAIQIAKYSLDYYLMSLHMAQQKGCVEEEAESLKMVEELRNDLVRLGYYQTVSC